MHVTNPPLPSGYSPVLPGQLVNAVTCLEMRAPPPIKPEPHSDDALVLQRWPTPDLEEYRALFRRIGEDWLWDSHLSMADDTLRALLDDPRLETYVLRDGPSPVGLLELDFREDGECELLFFGLVKEAIGQGAGRLLMNHAIARAWARPIRRFWLHTCHFDHPGAIAFYRRSGFTPYAFMVEVMDDPRLVGTLPRSAAPHVPLIEP